MWNLTMNIICSPFYYQTIIFCSTSKKVGLFKNSNLPCCFMLNFYFLILSSRIECLLIMQFHIVRLFPSYHFLHYARSHYNNSLGYWNYSCILKCFSVFFLGKYNKLRKCPRKVIFVYTTDGYYLFWITKWLVTMEWNQGIST